MEEMQEKLGAILSNPQMMQTIMQMASALGQQGPPPQQEAPKQQPRQQNQKSGGPALSQSPLGPKELEMLQKIAAFSRQTSLNQEQQALLSALHPYLSGNRLSRLEKAMHAAKIAEFAGVTLEQSGGSTIFGR